MITSNSFLGIKIIDLTDDTSIASLSDDLQYVTPPSGQLYRLINATVNIPDPAGSGSGTHFIKFQFKNINTEFSFDNDLFYVSSAHDVDIILSYGYVRTGDTKYPPDNIQQTQFLRNGITFNNANPLAFYYYNGTDVAQANSRKCNLMFEIYKECL